MVRYLLAPGTADDSIWPLLQEKQRTLNQVGLCKDNFNEVVIKKQNSSFVTDGIDLDISGIDSKARDIRDYFTPEKKRKLMDNSVAKDSSVDELDDMLNDGLDDLLCDINF